MPGIGYTGVDVVMNTKILRHRRRRRLVAIGGACMAALCAWRWGLLHAEETQSPAPQPALRREGTQLVVGPESPLRAALAVAAVAEERIDARFTLPAVVEADPARVVKVTTPAPGRIVTLDKRLGDVVKAGDVLFTIDAADLAQARADDAKARAALDLARSNLARQRTLAGADIAATRDLEQARGDYEQADSEAARTAARLAQLGARGAAPGRALAVRSPIGGRVVELAAGAGGYWNDATAALMVVADTSRVDVTANAREQDLAHIYEGQRVAVRGAGFGDVTDARVATLGWALDPDTRTLKVRLPVANRDGRLRPGMFAQADFAERPRRGIMLPLAAVVQDGFASRAFVEVAPWRFEARALHLGTQVGERIEVTAGLRAGERVVVRNGVLLND